MTLPVAGTDERLRYWLDANQLARERLCLAVMSLDGRFRNVEPRQPRGGPDGGRDLQAVFEDGRPAWGAVGFQNSVSDSPDDLRQAIRKFEDDLEVALAARADLKVFAFFTNVTLSVGKRTELAQSASHRGIETCIIYDREQIRSVLDSPRALGIRFQYLQIAMSQEEQSAFFSTWGSQLEDLIGTSFRAVDQRLERVEFAQNLQRPLRNLGFIVNLKVPLKSSEVGHFRIVLAIIPASRFRMDRSFLIGCCNAGGRWEADRPSRKPGLASAFWTLDPLQVVRRSLASLPAELTLLSAFGGYSVYDDPDETPTLGDLDERYWVIFANKSIAENIERVQIIANDYRLYVGRADELRFDSHHVIPEWPWQFGPEELADPWVRAMTHDAGGKFDFGWRIPMRLWTPELMSG